MVFFVILFRLINKWEHSDIQNDRDRVFDFVYTLFTTFWIIRKGYFTWKKKCKWRPIGFEFDLSVVHSLAPWFFFFFRIVRQHHAGDKTQEKKNVFVPLETRKMSWYFISLFKIELMWIYCDETIFCDEAGVICNMYKLFSAICQDETIYRIYNKQAGIT